MDNIQQEDLEEKVTPSVTEEETTEVVEQDPLKTELDKVQRKGRTKVEKLQYTKKRIDDQLKELGVEDELEEDDEKPVTHGELKRMQAQFATKTALDLANEVSNETERELLKYHLENTIRSTGNPQEDFKLAQNLVYAAKNQQIIEEISRKPQVNSHASNAGAPAKIKKQEEDLTAEEKAFMKPPFNLSKEAVLKARTNSN